MQYHNNNQSQNLAHTPQRFNCIRNSFPTRNIHLRLKSGITIGRRRRIALYFEIRSSLCGRKSRNIITDVRTRANFSNTAIDSSCFRSASSFASAVLRKRGRSYFLVHTAVLPTNGLLPHEKFIRIESGVIQTARVSSNREYSSARGIFRSFPLGFIHALTRGAEGSYFPFSLANTDAYVYFTTN